MSIRQKTRAHGSVKFELIIDGEAVSRAKVHDRQMRIGTARVRMGGIGGVHTARQHRMKGYSRRVMERCVEYMTEKGFDISLLFGISDFYPKWGYATAMADQWLTISAEAARRARSAMDWRRFRPTDMQRLLQIHARDNHLRTGSIVRPPFPDDGFPRGTAFNTRPGITVFLDSAEQMVGYVAIDEKRRNSEGEWEAVADELLVCEIGATGTEVYDGILEFLGRRADQMGVEQIQLRIPADHTFADFARSYGGWVQITTQPDGGPMMRIVNFRGLMGKLEGELRRRISGDCPDAALGLATDLGDLTIRAADGTVEIDDGLEGADQIFELEQWKLLQVVMGYRPLGQVICDPRCCAFAPEGGLAGASPSLTEHIAATADTLFPRQYAFCWPADKF